MKSKEEKAQARKLIRLLEYPEVKSWRALMGAFKTILSNLEKGLLAEGCSISRFQILFHLYFEGELAATNIAKKLFVTRGNITMFLRRMESDGLIKPVYSQGQKRAQFALTGGGVKFFEKVFPPHIKRIRKFVPIFSEQTMRALFRGQSVR